LTWIRVYRKLLKVKRESGIDLLHAFWLTEATLIGKIFCMAGGIPFLATTMGQDVKPENHYLMLIRYLSVPLILISDWQASFLVKIRNLEQVKVIPFGIDEDLYNKKEQERTIDILGAGSLNQIKNFSLFINIIGDLVKRFPDIRCLIIGDGSEREDLEDLIIESGLENTVELAGQMDYKSVIARMHQARFLLHTSSFEGQGLVITEALAAGLTVVSFPVGIAATLKSHKLFTGKSRQELTEYLVRLLNDLPGDFRPEIHYTIAHTCEEYVEVYKKLMI
jgi:1,2-diacylglycerol 3-alpha-glucosyltransferase